GDSFTFGEEVAFSETWGEYLANDLPSGTQALNFGVPGHAMDQTLLKFRRDVRPWKPKVVVFSFLSASPLRNTGIYLFLRPDLELPYSKPRFRLVNGQLELLNFPPRSAASLLAEPSVWNLPLLELDSEFEARQWTMPLFGSSYLARYVAASFPRWTPRRERFPDDAIVALAVRIIRQMVSEVEADGAVPVVVSLPVKADLAGGPTHYRDAVSRDLGEAGIEVLDLAPCLMQGLSIETAYVGDAARSSGPRDPGMAHYSPAGNRTVAACLLSRVSAALDLR
ncbi:MAG: hypothetical protein Q8N51_12870, partial [Gammaproteobacteria bacterium]|nr:hypothetical protein [Gammaproteobacteria bacterium]